ncbi:MAG TPA: outer membrane beta-barrel protein [Steroidobacteraceae bacterium]|nr:outer membrane beta-barrel protein [Steroidobacteraceae bacterium]
MRPSARACAIITRSVIAALALAAPALALAQTAAPPPGTAEVPPVQAVPGVGSAGALLPGAMIPPRSAADLAPEPAEFTRYGVAAGVGETDNVNLATTHPKSQTLAAANLDFGVKRSGSRLDATAVGNFTDLYYVQGAYSNQVLGRFDGLALVKLWPEHFNWTIGDSYGEEQTDPFSAITPLSLQRVNVFQTGPQLTLHPTDATFVNLDAGYSRITYQRSPFDGHDFLGSFELGRRLSPLSKLSLVAEAESLRFDNTTLNTNYDRRQAYGRYLIEGARTSIDAQLGATQANDIGSWKTSPLVRLLLTRRLSPFSVVTFSGGREYTDSGGSFSNLTANTAGGILVAPSSQTTANYQRDYGSAGWRFVRLRTTIGLTADWERDTHDLQRIFDARREDVAIDLGRSLTPQLFANLTGSVDRYEYINQGFTDKFGTVSAGLAYQAGRWVVVYARYDHAFRRGSGVVNPLFGGTEYDENRVFIMIGYRPHARTGASGQPGFGGAPKP